MILIAVQVAPMIQNAFPGAGWNRRINANSTPPRFPNPPTIPEMKPYGRLEGRLIERSESNLRCCEVAVGHQREIHAISDFRKDSGDSKIP